MKKYFASAFLALLLAALCIVSTAAFSDTENYKFKEEIDRLAEYKLVVGINENEFGVNQNVTRQQMALFIARVMLGRTVIDATDYTTKHPFKDVTDPTYDAAISFCYENKIIAGRTKDTFDPFSNVTKQDALTMALRALGYDGLSYPDGYADYRQCFPGFFSGMNAGEEVYLSDPATRGDVAALMYTTLITPLRKNVNGTFEQEHFCSLEESLYIAAWDLHEYLFDNGNTHFNKAPSARQAIEFASYYLPYTVDERCNSRNNEFFTYKGVQTVNGISQEVEFKYWAKRTYSLSELESAVMQMFNLDSVDMGGDTYWKTGSTYDDNRAFHYIIDSEGHLCIYSGIGYVISPSFMRKKVSRDGEIKQDLNIAKVSDNVYEILIRHQETSWRDFYDTIQIEVLDPTKKVAWGNIKYLSDRATAGIVQAFMSVKVSESEVNLLSVNKDNNTRLRISSEEIGYPEFHDGVWEMTFAFDYIINKLVDEQWKTAKSGNAAYKCTGRVIDPSKPITSENFEILTLEQQN